MNTSAPHNADGRHKVSAGRGSLPIELETLFTERFTDRPEIAVRLLGAGSDRRYWRLTAADGRTAIGVEADNVADAGSFIALDCVFRTEGLSVPEVYGFTPDCRFYLQEDLGHTDLLSLLHTEEGESLVERCMRSLARMQTVSESEWGDAVAYRPLSERLIMWDLNYFKYEYLKPSGVVFDEDRLEDDFCRLCRHILDIPAEGWGFMYRDCQSRNVMVKKGEPYWIDFQGGRRGPVLYDAVSFLWQAKAGFSPEFRCRMLDVYADEFCRLRHVRREQLLAPLADMSLFRMLQVLGAYGFRGLVQRRAHFIESIPPALSNLSGLIADGALNEYPELREACSRLVADERFACKDDDGRLTVTVFSFSYKKGYPDDFSGNGGGFMFDCRAMHNPGRYAEYKQLTGLDSEVITFLESKGEVQKFTDSALELVSPAVDRYLKRGFSSLQIGFGCTGGQHRSVYCAQHVAVALAARFPQARVRLIHRERSLEQHLNYK